MNGPPLGAEYPILARAVFESHYLSDAGLYNTLQRALRSVGWELALIRQRIGNTIWLGPWTAVRTEVEWT